MSFFIILEDDKLINQIKRIIINKLKICQKS